MNRIKSLRLSQQLSQKQLAKKTAIPVRLIRAIEAGEETNTETLSILAKFFALPCSELEEELNNNKKLNKMLPDENQNDENLMEESKSNKPPAPAPLPTLSPSEKKQKMRYSLYKMVIVLLMAIGFWGLQYTTLSWYFYIVYLVIVIGVFKLLRSWLTHKLILVRPKLSE